MLGPPLDDTDDEQDELGPVGDDELRYTAGLVVLRMPPDSPELDPALRVAATAAVLGLPDDDEGHR